MTDSAHPERTSVAATVVENVKEAEDKALSDRAKLKEQKAAKEAARKKEVQRQKAAAAQNPNGESSKSGGADEKKQLRLCRLLLYVSTISDGALLCLRTGLQGPRRQDNSE
ncbi:hypothetical protein SLS59_007335 [Nothophoma quercina]|uniref:Uncharacterized protein n=1 Tax=Nothophoma quercina TaxID=749835 RepID=A0ABR3QZS2_9PLEO